MGLERFLKKRVHIILCNGFTFTGKVIEADESSLVMIDKKNETVFLQRDAILKIVEQHYE